MYLGDSIFQAIAKYNFLLFRDKLSVPLYLEQHYEKYTSDICAAVKGGNPFLGDQFAVMLEDVMPLLDEICSEIVGICKKYANGFIKDAYISAYALFDKMQPHLLSRFSWKKNSGYFFRLRAGDYRIKNPTESKVAKAELFHIKQSKSHLIGAYRYSVPGFPCLYLSSDIELAWYECGMPRQFSYCGMIVDEQGEDALRLVDFSNRPLDVISSLNCWLLNAKGDDEREKIHQYFVNYIISYPLAAACSLKVKNRNNKYIEEYIIPQIFMQWIREKGYFDGIRYKSSLYTHLVKGMGATNAVLPVKTFRGDGLGENLTSKITVSDIYYMDVDNEFRKCQAVLDEIEEYKNSLYSDAIGSKYNGSYIWELMDICDTVVRTYDALMNGNYANSELLFSYVNTLADYISFLNKTRVVIADHCSNTANDYEKEYVDKDKIIMQISEFYGLMDRIVHKHHVFYFNFETPEHFEMI